MNDNKTYRVTDLKFRNRITEDEQAVVDSNLDAALLDLSNRAKDPTVSGMFLTAVIKGVDDTIDLAELTLARNNDASEPSRMSYTLASWQHRVPESVSEVYDKLSSNLGIYYTDMTEPDDNFESMAVALGDPTAEIIITTQTENTEQAFFSNVEEFDDVECESDGC